MKADSLGWLVHMVGKEQEMSLDVARAAGPGFRCHNGRWAKTEDELQWCKDAERRVSISIYQRGQERYTTALYLQSLGIELDTQDSGIVVSSSREGKAGTL